MKKFNVTFLHTDGDTRIISIEAFNEEMARLRFEVNWGADMKILKVEPTTMKTITEFRRAMTVGSFWDVTLLWNNGQIWLPTKRIVSGECVRVSNNRFTINDGVEDLNVDFPFKENFHHKGANKIEISTTRIKKFKLIISKSK